jgi:hypothetical protein
MVIHSINSPMTTSSHKDFLLETIKSFFNHQIFSDVELHIGEHKFYLISNIVSKCMPKVLPPGTTLDTATPMATLPTDLQSPEQLTTYLATFLSKFLNKHVIRIGHD